jgi:hypothetical protein
VRQALLVLRLQLLAQPWPRRVLQHQRVWLRLLRPLPVQQLLQARQQEPLFALWRYGQPAIGRGLS